MSSLLEANDNNFNEMVLASKSTVIVEFGATWCGPCKKQLPILEDLASRREDLKVVKVDIDQSPSVTKEYGIRSVPTIMLFVNGEKKSSRTGLTDMAKLQSMLEE